MFLRPAAGVHVSGHIRYAQVAVSPYRVPAKDKYQHSKHIEGGKIVTRMARNQSKPFPKALVEVSGRSRVRNTL